MYTQNKRIPGRLINKKTDKENRHRGCMWSTVGAWATSVRQTGDLTKLPRSLSLTRWGGLKF